jgi:hypothetical protein
MRAALVVWIALVSSTARADDAVGVIVMGGGPTIQADVHDFVEEWLRSHGNKISRAPLADDAITAFTNCLVIDDQNCARGVVDARSSATSIVYARIDMPDKTKRTLSFTTYWFVRGHEGVAERRSCEHCTESAWHGLVDDMLGTLAKNSAAKTGHLTIDSTPSGLVVQFDNQEIGITPLERDVAAGTHRVVVMSDGHKVASSKVDVTADDTTNLRLTADLAPAHASRLWPSVLLGTGIAALVAGTIYLYYGSLGGPNQKYTYPASTPVGVAFIAVGLGATVGGSILLAQTAASSGPVASITPTGAYVGWWTRF